MATPMVDAKAPTREDILAAEILKLEALSEEEITQRTKILESNMRAMKADITALTHTKADLDAKQKDLTDRIKKNKQLPYIVSNVSEIIELKPDEDDEEDQASQDIKQNHGKALVINTSTRINIFLPVIGLVPLNELKPGDIVGINKDSYIIFEKLPPE